MIDKIRCEHKFGSDIHKYLIALLKQASIDVSMFPEEISEEEYYAVKNNMDAYEDWYVGLVGFCASFSSKWFNGYARNGNRTTIRSKSSETIRNIIKQAPNLKGIEFNCCDFTTINGIKDFVIYCDPPYKGSTQYAGTAKFPYEEFYEWCKKMSRDNVVLVSEYDMPDGFDCIWEKKTKVTICSTRNSCDDKDVRVEKLFICK